MAGQDDAKLAEELALKTMTKSVLQHVQLTDSEKIGPLTKENLLALMDHLAALEHARWWPPNLVTPEDPEEYKRDKKEYVRELQRKPVYRMAMSEVIQVARRFAGRELKLILQNTDLLPGDSFGVMDVIRAYAIPSTEMAKDKLVDSMKTITMADYPQLTYEEYSGRMRCKMKLAKLAGREFTQEAENNIMMNGLNVGQMKAAYDMLKGLPEAGYR